VQTGSSGGREGIMNPEECPACGMPQWKALQVLRGQYEIQRCRSCGLLRSKGTPREGTGEDEFGGLDLDSYFKSLENLRRESAEQLLQKMEQHVPVGSLLDVGCSFGWFLDVAKTRGWDTFGIEPSDIAVGHVQKRAAHQVLHGVFPATSFGERRFTSAVMTDVLEHLDNPVLMLQQLAAVLEPGGVLAIRVPNQEGLIYKTAATMARGAKALDGPMWRMWQLDFPYPHLWYFNRKTLSAVATRAGLQVLEVETEPVLRVRSVGDRVRYTTGPGGSMAKTALLTAGLGACALASEGLRMHDECYVIARPKP